MSTPLTVEDLMTTAVIALKATESVERAREEMALAEIRHIPVIDDRSRVIGIVSNRDFERAKRGAHLRRVGDIMSHPVRTVRPESPAADAASMMIDDKIGSLPVVGSDEQLVGIVTETDFLLVAHQALSGQPLRARR